MKVKQQQPVVNKTPVRWPVLAAVLVISLMFVNCATAPEPVPVTDHNTRIKFKGISVLPPKGEGWYQLHPTSSDAPGGMFVRRIDPSTSLGITQAEPHTIRAAVIAKNAGLETFRSAEHFRDFVKREEEQGTPASRFRVLEEKYTIDNRLGTYCVRLDKVTEDRGSSHFPGSVLVMGTNTLYCVHPKHSKTLVVVGCSQRAMSREKFLKLDAECEPFIQSLEFTKY